MNKTLHISVLLDEVLENLNIHDDGIYFDGTLGLAGHAKAILDKADGKIKYLGFDRDINALALAQENLADYANQVEFFHSSYSNFAEHLQAKGIKKLSGVLLDLGVSSMQLDKAERGFSYHQDAKLDMRMDTTKGQSAAEFLSTVKQDELKNIIEKYGEDPLASRIASAIVEARQVTPITSTKELADIVYHSYPAKWRREARNHPSTRTFQAIRIHINDELGELERFLAQVLDLMEVGGRITIISFHSLEDRIVKQAFKLWATDCICNKSNPICVCKHKAEVKMITRKPITPSQAELRANPRSASAKLRVIEKLA